MKRALTALLVSLGLAVTGFVAPASAAESTTVSVVNMEEQPLGAGTSLSGSLIAADESRIPFSYVQGEGSTPTEVSVEGLADGQYRFVESYDPSDIGAPAPFRAQGTVSGGVLELISSNYNNLTVALQSMPDNKQRVVKVVASEGFSETKTIDSNGSAVFTVVGNENYRIEVAMADDPHGFRNFVGGIQRVYDAKRYDLSAGSLTATLTTWVTPPTGKVKVVLKEAAGSTYGILFENTATGEHESATVSRGQTSVTATLRPGSWRITGVGHGTKDLVASTSPSNILFNVQKGSTTTQSLAIAQWQMAPNGLKGETGEARVRISGYDTLKQRDITLTRGKYTITRTTSGKYTTFTRLPAGTYVATVDGMVTSKKVVVKSGARADVTLPSFKSGRQLGGTVKTASGSPREGATVQLVSRTSGKVRAVTYTDSKGKYNFSGVPAGKVKVVVWPTHYRTYIGEGRVDGSNLGRVAVNVDVSSSSTKITRNLTMKKPSTLTGVVKDSKGKPVEGINVRLRYQDQLTYEAWTDAKGKFVVEGLPQGLTVRTYVGDNEFSRGYDNISKTVKASGSTSSISFTVSPWW